jgi:DivIVA domain-containing protein
VDIDRQAIERRDFPIGRRGYDPAAVDAHLRALAAEFEELGRANAGGGQEPSLASTAATQVQSILDAAETAAADIERQALQSAKQAREEAEQDAERTRQDAVERAQAHVAAVAAATSVLAERVSSMDGEVSALVESLRAGAGRLAADLAAVETNMGELYDSASGRAEGAIAKRSSAGAIGASAAAAPADPRSGEGVPTAPPAVASSAFGPPPAPKRSAPKPAAQEPAAQQPAAQEPAAPQPVTPRPAAAPTGGQKPAGANGDLDGARLIALNMALNGESRADADRYLAENFQLADRQKLIDEVYAAIEG